MSRTFVVTAPDPVVSLAAAKAHLNIEHTDDDDLIEAMIAAATGHIDGPEGWLGRAIGIQTLEHRSDYFCGQIELPYQPIVSVTSVKYLDADDVEQTFSSGSYSLIGDRITLGTNESWPSTSCQPESVRARYVAGWATVPPAIVAAIKMMTADLYMSRETFVVGTISSASAMSATAAKLLAPFRRW